MSLSLTATARAHWVTPRHILWAAARSAGHTYRLHVDPEGRLALTAAGLLGGRSLRLMPALGPDAKTRARFPHLAGLPALALEESALAEVPEILRGQAVVAAHDRAGWLVDVTALQVPGVLDALYPYTGPLGVAWEAGRPVFRLWAPTARAVNLHLYLNAVDPAVQQLPMSLEAATGVWSVRGLPAWRRWYYRYEVEVFVRATGRLERNLVTDPYSLSLSTNSTRSQVVDLADKELAPAGWATLAKPPLAAPEDSVIYELHVRDFSLHDHTVPEAERGTYKAFTRLNSNGMRHLRALAEAGLTHLHLLPVFDIATIDEDRARRVEPDEALLQTFPPDSPRQQEIVDALRTRDGFNWGYDPYHYTVPEGSYATDPDGPARIVEFRQMVQALNRLGLRVVMDVVYNHTHASGQNAHSVLDRIVPGYYHRLDADGRVETSTCCANTATEHAMMEKLMVDSLVTWARAYKVDGFRFDLMGHHMVDNMLAVRSALDALTLERDGVDGRALILYGEAWSFGEVVNDGRGRNAGQHNIGGTGLGAFNDRFRDALRGGNPFGEPREQGFTTGLYFEPNEAERRSPEDQRRQLLAYADWLRVGLAGNLRDFRLEAADGRHLTGGEVRYNGHSAGYTLDPQEHVPYVSAHDNETLFDILQLKAAAGTSLAERVRLNNLALSLVMLAQGLPFFHAGDDLLRSKSMDRNSFDSGDWFNKLDFTYETNNWGVGLPPRAENEARWPLMAPRLADPALRPGPAEILAAAAHFREMLRVRRSSRLFRLRTAAEVQRRLSFLNTGPGQLAGLIVLRLLNAEPELRDEPYRQVAVLFNAAPHRQVLAAEVFRSARLQLHPVLAASADPVVRQARFDPVIGTFVTPGRTAAVFVELL
jgi:pullulanase-type alpha-1,6-glucosidase